MPTHHEIATVPSLWQHGAPIDAGDTVALGGFFTEGDGGGGSFLAFAPGAGETAILPDYGLVFPTFVPPAALGAPPSAPTQVVLVRQDAGLLTHPTFAEAFPRRVASAAKRTTFCEGPAHAAWWGAVKLPAGGPAGVAYTVDHLLAALYGQVPTTPAVLAEDAYPFFLDGVFLQRNERTDWNSGSGKPVVRAISLHTAAIQAAIERTRPQSGLSSVTVTGPDDLALTRRLAVRRPTALAFERGVRLVGRATGFPQNVGLFVVPSFGAMAGVTEEFGDEHYLGEAVPGISFEDRLPNPADPSRLILPVPLPTELAVGERVHCDVGGVRTTRSSPSRR